MSGERSEISAAVGCRTKRRVSTRPFNRSENQHGITWALVPEDTEAHPTISSVLSKVLRQGVVVVGGLCYMFGETPKQFQTAVGAPKQREFSLRSSDYTGMFGRDKWDVDGGGYHAT